MKFVRWVTRKNSPYLIGVVLQEKGIESHWDEASLRELIDRLDAVGRGTKRLRRILADLSWFNAALETTPVYRTTV